MLILAAALALAAGAGRFLFYGSARAVGRMLGEMDKRRARR